MRVRENHIKRVDAITTYCGRSIMAGTMRSAAVPPLCFVPSLEELCEECVGQFDLEHPGEREQSASLLADYFGEVGS